MIATTTLNKLREHDPCTRGWKKLLAHIGKRSADDDVLPLSVILKSNGLDDALWALRAAGCDREARLFACDCAQTVAHLNTDPRVQTSIDTARRFADGNATRKELAVARAAACFAASAAAVAAACSADENAAWAAAWAATEAAACAPASAAAKAARKQLFIKHFCAP